MNEENDLIITPYEELPQEVKDICSSKDENQDDYAEMSRIEEELKAIDWYMDYYLDAEVTELRPMTQEEINERDNDILERKARG